MIFEIIPFQEFWSIFINYNDFWIYMNYFYELTHFTFFLGIDFKNGCENEFKDNNEKSYSWSRKSISHKIDFKAEWPRNGHADSVRVYLDHPYLWSSDTANRILKQKHLKSWKWWRFSYLNLFCLGFLKNFSFENEFRWHIHTTQLCH